jgi:hypothetical protein
MSGSLAIQDLRMSNRESRLSAVPISISRAPRLAGSNQNLADRSFAGMENMRSRT